MRGRQKISDNVERVESILLFLLLARSSEMLVITFNASLQENLIKHLCLTVNLENARTLKSFIRESGIKESLSEG